MPIFIPIMLFLVLWALRQIKGLLFWLYVWQLKEYRFERFTDHFRTESGKKSFVNKLSAAKLLIIFSFLILPFTMLTGGTLVSWVVLALLYGVETGKGIMDLKKKRLRKPVFTKKALFLCVLCGIALLVLSIGVYGIALQLTTVTHNVFTPFIIFPVGLLILDLLTPFIVSAVVLGLQPFTIFIRNRRLAQAKAKRATFKNLKVVGIAGSYGKTSTKEFLSHILSAKFAVAKTPEHQNSEFGVANTILYKLTDTHEIFVCEMGAYKKGEIKALAEVARPHIGIVTGVNEQHLATFGSMENLLSAEGGKELAEALLKDGVLIVNGNNEYCRKLGEKIEKPEKVFYYIFGAAAPNMLQKGRMLQAKDIRIEKDKVSFEAEGVKFEVPAYGAHNVENLLGAIAAAQELGMTAQEIAQAAETIPLELSPLKVSTGAGGATIIDSTYSANPDGVIADLEYLRLYEGKKVLVMPCLIELGQAAQRAHERIGKKIGEVCDLAIIITKEHFADIKKGADQSEKVVYMENAQEIIEKVKDAHAILLESRLPESLVRILKND